MITEDKEFLEVYNYYSVDVGLMGHHTQTQMLQTYLLAPKIFT